MSSVTAERDAGIARYPISGLEAVARGVIREVPDKDLRWAMWRGFNAAVERARQASIEYPWDDPRTLTAVTPENARAVLLGMFGAIPDSAERSRLAPIAAREAKLLEERLKSGAPVAPDPDGGSLERHCASCGKRYRAQRPGSRYCSQACRQTAYRLRRRR